MTEATTTNTVTTNPATANTATANTVTSNPATTSTMAGSMATGGITGSTAGSTAGATTALRPLRHLAVVLALITIANVVGSVRQEPPGHDASAVVVTVVESPPPASTTTADDTCDVIRDSLRPRAPRPSVGEMPAGSRMAEIAERGRLIVGVDQGKYLVGYRDPATGQLEGADIDLARMLATAILGHPERVQYVVLNIADRQRAIETGEVDLVVNSFAVTCRRQRTVEYSTGYLSASMRLLVPAGSGITNVEDLAGKTVCTSTGSTTADVLRSLPVDLDVVTVPGLPNCMVELHRARAAAVASDDVLLAGLAAQDPQAEVVGRSLLNTDYAVGLSPEDPDLVRFVNAVLEDARNDGSLDAINRRWLGEVLQPLPRVPAARYRD